MVHTAIANDNLYKYLQKTSGKCDGCAVGLVLGQPNAQKDYLIHLTKTPLQPLEGGEATNKKSKSPKKSIDEINDVFVANHAKTATRTLSGGMYVIGIFVISQGDVLAPFSAKVKTILSKMNQLMEANKDFCGNPPTGTRLVINFNQLSQQVTAKCYDINTCVVKPAEIKFQDNGIVWKELEYVLDLNSLFPIIDKDIELPLRRHIMSILSCVRNNLERTAFLYDGEFKDSSETVDTIGQKKKTLRSKSATTTNTMKENKVSQVSILLPSACTTKESHPTEVQNCGGLMKLNGQLSGKLYLHPNTTIENAAKSVKEDIIRSLSYRLEMHCDSLTEEEHNSVEDSSIIHEPPRRVLVTMEETNEVLNDYLFPGEGTEDAASSADEVLDAKIQESNIVELEGQADIKELIKACESNMELPILMKHTNKFMYYMGAGVAIAVLVISLLVHFLFQN